jgi:hypothetical protein
MQDTFWLDEPVAPSSSDPLFLLMLERGEVEDLADTEDLRLGVRQQAMLSAWIEYSHSVEETECISEDKVCRTLHNAVLRTTARLLKRIETGQISLADALTQLSKLGVERDEAVTLLIGE